MKRFFSLFIVIALTGFARPGYAADSFSYSGSNSNSFAAAGGAMGGGQTIMQGMQSNPQMGSVAGFFQSYMMVHGLTRFIQSILSVATANPNLKGCPSTDSTLNFSVTDPKGTTMGYYVVASAKDTNVPADAKTAGLTCSLAISLGSSAEKALQNASNPVMFVYTLPGATGASSTGFIMINKMDPSTFLANPVKDGTAPPPNMIPPFSGYYGWKKISGGDAQAIGFFSLTPPPASTDAPSGAPGGGMVIFYKESVSTSQVAKIAFTNSLPAYGSTAAVVMNMVGSGSLGLNSAGMPGPIGNWTVAVSAVLGGQQTGTTPPPPPPSATTINFASVGAVPTFVSSSATPPSINQGQMSMGQITAPASGSGSTCGQGGTQLCVTFSSVPSSSSTTAPGLPTGVLPPAPGAGGTQPSSTFSGIFGSSAMTFSSAPGMSLVTF